MDTMVSAGRQTGLREALGASRVIPVIVIDDLQTAVPLAKALVAGGLTALEVTLRTPVALDAIRLIAAEVEGASVGVGTCLTPKHLEQAREAGATFAVSPGVTAELIRHADVLPLLPGAATPSESMRLADEGFAFQKFFPTEPSGGAPYLAALASVLQQVKFCPTGGVRPETMGAYLKLPNVFAVGGSWMAPSALVKAGDWAGITRLASQPG